MVVQIPQLRADAQRNLERILKAAREVFAEEGREASVADDAARAVVGTATIFRRFPTKDDLVAAILERELETINERARVAVGAEDPASALGEFVEWGVERFIDDRCLCEASSGDFAGRPRFEELIGELTSSVELLLERAQKAGAVRRDVVAEDIGFLLNAVGHAGLALERTAPGAWRRYVTILLDGLRPEGATPLAGRPPTAQQLHEAKATVSAARGRKPAAAKHAPAR